MPISKIQEGDIFQEKYPFELLMWLVLEVNKGEKMVKVQAYDLKSKPVGKPKWLSNTNKIFSESNLIMHGDGNFLYK
ncbi:hypothetical protein THYS13_15120 [Thermoanaerobacter sp. YS13]|uniref:hypothetical protein n=1 Tax=Thermoanaerobacter sp. YS13 TaxID=1511746 RepID=UPI000575CF0D|nr:hypothetical protein [Thermoanaerobacter sp. YS13]KHO63386.1 hypothetical protein THYS13_15120 [Thermoanaerobacter sp. YS13]